MRKLIRISIPVLLFATAIVQAQIGHNCPGEHPDLLRDKSGQVRFLAPEQLSQMASKKVQPVTPKTQTGIPYDSFVTFKILVNKDGEVDCIWANAGNPIFLPAADEAGRSWKFKPMVVNGKPVEFVGTLKFRFLTGR